MSLPPSERRLRAQLASYESWANTEDRTERTAPARAAQLARFAKLVDPDEAMPPAARAKAADAAMKAHYTRMALKSAASRRKAKQLLTAPDRGSAA
jgi:hypothetical protein